MKQIPINNVGGGISRTICSHYHKVGWSDILTAKISVHSGIIVITDAPNPDKPR